MDAETGRSLAGLIRKERVAHLGTLRGGAPLVSMTLFMAGQDLAAFYVHVSRLAWHTQDMLQDPRVALSIAETDDGRADPFTLMRVSIRGEASQLPQVRHVQRGGSRGDQRLPRLQAEPRRTDRA